MGVHDGPPSFFFVIFEKFFDFCPKRQKILVIIYGAKKIYITRR